MEEFNIYIDGSCINNGKKDAVAGYAVYFGEDDPRNEYSRVMGKQSNNTAELTALISAIEKIDTDNENNKYNIYTDSEYVIKCITTYGKKQAENGWVENIKNKNLVKRAFELYNKNKNIKIHYIQAHTGQNDIHSVGNAEADRLAKLSIGMTTIEPKICILDWITFKNKDKAKELGAKWNMKKKYWYVYDTVDFDVMEELEKLKEDVIKLPWITFKNKDKAKELGAQWNSKDKYWYVKHTVDEETMKKLINLHA